MNAILLFQLLLSKFREKKSLLKYKSRQCEVEGKKSCKMFFASTSAWAEMLREGEKKSDKIYECCKFFGCYFIFYSRNQKSAIYFSRLKQFKMQKKIRVWKTF